MTLYEQAKMTVNSAEDIYYKKLDAIEWALDILYNLDEDAFQKEDRIQAFKYLRTQKAIIYKERLEELQAKARKERDDIIGYMTEGWNDDSMSISLAHSGVTAKLSNLKFIYEEMGKCELELDCLKRKGVQI